MNNQNNTSTGEPVNQAPGTSENPTPAPDSATPASTAPEKTGKVETPAPANPAQADAAVDVRRQRVEELKKSLTSGSGSVATTPATRETPTPGTNETPAEIGTAATDTSQAPAEIISTTPATAPVPADTIATPAAPPSTAAEDIASKIGLPAGYLADGYCKVAGKTHYIDPDLLDKTAQQVARALAQCGLKQSSFNPILRELKRANKKRCH